jgi:hypothetical protein
MKNKFSFLVAVALSLFSQVGFAQEILVVEPGEHTLNTAIKTYGGTRIYQLKAGEWYQLDAPIQNVAYHLQIIGQEPAVKGGKPATLQTNATAQGVVFSKMFDAQGDITLKNIYFVNADLTGVTGTAFMNNTADNARTVIDRCIIDPVSTGSALILSGKQQKTYYTNNLANRMGHQLSPNDGHFFKTARTSTVGFDTLLVQNNTFVCMGTSIHNGDLANTYLDNFSKWDHNTFVEQKSQIDWQKLENEYYWTNNLMFDMQTQPWSPTWNPMPGSDKGLPNSAMIYADTIPGDVLPSKTIQFVEYNMHYRNPKFYALINELNVQGQKDGKRLLNYMPLMWPTDSSNVSRESKLFANDTSFPYWKAGNNTSDVDPQWADARIYTMSDNFVAWTKPATQIHALGYLASSFPIAANWTKWHWDPDGDTSNNLTWPLFNGVYSNPAMLIGSIEGLPLGDLNWFPEAKALWAKNKTRIDAHLKAAIEGKLDMLSGVKSINLSDIKTSCYPNPFSSQLTISYTVKNTADVKLTVLTLNGQIVSELVNQSQVAGEYTAKWNGTNVEGALIPNGVYLYRLQVGNEVASARFVKIK